MRKMYDMFCVYTYPKFKEISNIIPKKAFYHMYEDGSICYAPPKRPLVEKWSLGYRFGKSDKNISKRNGENLLVCPLLWVHYKIRC